MILIIRLIGRLSKERQWVRYEKKHRITVGMCSRICSCTLVGFQR